MMTPPPVSGMPYANTAGSDARSNYLGSECDLFTGLHRQCSPGFRLLLQSSAVTYSILPSVSLDRSTPRQLEQFTYSPSFNFYEATSNPNSTEIGNLDSIDQNAAITFQYRFNPKVAFNVAG